LNKSVAIIASFPESLIRFRAVIIKMLVAQGCEVVCIGPPARAEVLASLEAFGARYYPVEMDRAGTGFRSDLYYLLKLYRILRRIGVGVVFSYTIKPVIFGSIAARLAGVGNIYSMVTGLGIIYSSNSLKIKTLRILTDFLYRIAFGFNRCVFFQNRDDEKLFRDRGLLARSVRTMIVNGSGVDLGLFSQSEPLKGPLRYTMIGRLIRTKGVKEYTEAARRILQKSVDVRVTLVGMKESGHLDAVEENDLEFWKTEERASLLDWTDDVRPVLNETSVYVLPSYREGMPRTVLEAMAIGRGVVTTDVPGCRETVEEGVNGFLVPVRDSCALYEAMNKFVGDRSLVVRMGIQSRRIALEKFDDWKVNRFVVDVLLESIL
jgi:glycosyltransferase involved in cell wall biosynthesis